MSLDMKEQILHKQRVQEVVLSIKNGHNYQKAWDLMEQYGFSCEQIISSTVKLGLDDLIILVDQNLLQQES